MPGAAGEAAASQGLNRVVGAGVALTDLLLDRDPTGTSPAQGCRARHTWTERRAENRTGAGGCFLASTTTVTPPSFASCLAGETEREGDGAG